MTIERNIFKENKIKNIGTDTSVVVILVYHESKIAHKYKTLTFDKLYVFFRIL